MNFYWEIFLYDFYSIPPLRTETFGVQISRAVPVLIWPNFLSTNLVRNFHFIRLPYLPFTVAVLLRLGILTLVFNFLQKYSSMILFSNKKIFSSIWQKLEMKFVKRRKMLWICFEIVGSLISLADMLYKILCKTKFGGLGEICISIFSEGSPSP